MASKKTSTFYLTERLTCTAGATEVTATIDLGAYVDVADRQAIAIESVDLYERDLSFLEEYLCRYHIGQISSKKTVSTLSLL